MLHEFIPHSVQSLVLGAAAFAPFHLNPARPPDLPFVDVLEPSQSCADFTGDWYRAFDGIIVSLTQMGCKVRGGMFGHKFIMVANGNVAFGNIQRTYNGCTTIVTARLTKLSDTQLREEWLGTDGVCDLGTGYTQDIVYDKL